MSHQLKTANHWWKSARIRKEKKKALRCTTFYFLYSEKS